MNKVFVCCLLFLLTACQEHIVYHFYQPVDTTGWKKSDTLYYTFTPDIVPDNYLLEIGIRHKDSYPYQDIWLAISQTNHTDTIHLFLSEESGMWKGNGIGENRQFTESIPNIQLFSTDSIHTLSVVHIMENDTLKGIKDVGLCIRRHP